MVHYHLTELRMPADYLQLMPLCHGVTHLAVHIKVWMSQNRARPLSGLGKMVKNEESYMWWRFSHQRYCLPHTDTLIAKIVGGKKNGPLLNLCTSIKPPMGCSSMSHKTSTHLCCSSWEHYRKCHHFSSSMSIAPKWPISCLGCVFSRFYHPLL